MKRIASYAAAAVLMVGFTHTLAAQETDVVETKKGEVLPVQEEIDQVMAEVAEAPAAAAAAAESAETAEAAAAEYGGMSPALMIGLLLLALVLVVLAVKQLRKA